MSDIHPSELTPSTHEILMMFYGGNPEAAVSKQYTSDASNNADAANLMANVTIANEREAKRKAQLKAAQERKRQLKAEKENNGG